MRTRIFTGIVGLMMAVAAVTLSVATPALAATNPGCGTKCEGKDPSTYFLYDTATDAPYTCADDAYTVYTASADTAVAELRYSPRCRTAWVRGACYEMYCEVTVESWSGSTRRKVYTAVVPNLGSTHSLMTNDAGYKARACTWYSGRDGRQICTTRW